MEAALLRKASSYSRYGSTTHKQVYLYGRLDRSPTELPFDMGFAWGVAGITVVPLIGVAADHFGLQTVLWAVVLAPLAGLPLALRLPEA